MTDVRWLSQKEQQMWRPFAELMLSLPPRLEEPLRAHGLTFFDYSLLVVLSHAEDFTKPMSEIAHLANGSLSRVSHAARRLEERGLVERSQCPEDGRVTWVTLTDDGQALLEKAAPSHVDSVRELVLDALTPEEAEQLGHLATAVLRRVSPTNPWVAERS